MNTKSLLYSLRFVRFNPKHFFCQAQRDKYLAGPISNWDSVSVGTLNHSPFSSQRGGHRMARHDYLVFLLDRDDAILIIDFFLS